MAGSKVEELGGGYFGCFQDIGTCAVGCLCPCITWGQAMEAAGEGTCLCHACAVYCVPCWLPFVTASGQTSVDRKLGGQGDGFLKACLCHCLCPHCAICMVARAVNKGKEQGLLKGVGAPEGDVEMTK